MRCRCHIADLCEADTIVQADPFLAIEAQVGLSSTFKEWRARVDADKMEPGYEAP